MGREGNEGYRGGVIRLVGVRKGGVRGRDDEGRRTRVGRDEPSTGK